MKNFMLWACVAAYGVLTALLIFQVPIGATPDEGAHLEYAQYLFDKNALPVFQPKGANFPGYEFHQPPLYYAACAAIWKVLPPVSRPFAARFVSLICGALALVFLWHSVRLLFPDDQGLAPLATGFCALWPLHIGVGASAGNDAAAGLLCAGIFWAMARMAARDEYSIHDAIVIGLFFGLGMLCKSSCLTVGLASVGAAFFIARRRSSTRIALLSSLAVCVVALLVCGAWLLRNQNLYGDPLAARIFDDAFKNSSPRPQALMAATGVSFPEYLRAYFIVLFATCWGFFGGPNTAIGVLNPFGKSVAPQAFSVLPLMMACLIATVICVWGMARFKLRAWSEIQNDDWWNTRHIALFWWGVGFFLVMLALLRFNLIQFQAQARYLHPALLPMALSFALGWKEIFGGGKALRIFCALFLASLLVITLCNALIWKTLV